MGGWNLQTVLTGDGPEYKIPVMNSMVLLPSFSFTGLARSAGRAGGVM